MSNEQRYRLEQEKNTLEQSYELQSEKIARLRKDLVIETDTLRKFQYEQQIKNEEIGLKSLTERLDEIEKQLQSTQLLSIVYEHNKNRVQITPNIPVSSKTTFTLSIVIIFLLIFLLTGIGIYLYYENKNIISNNNISTLAKENKITISNLVVAEKDKYYRIEVTVYNPLNREISVNHLKISKESQTEIYCSLVDYPHYIISDKVYISKLSQVSNLLNLPIFPKKGALLGAKYLAKGEQTNVCGTSSFNLSFDTSFLLKANSYTFFLVDIPKELKLSQAKYVISGETINMKSIKTMMTPQSLNDEFRIHFESFQINVSIITDIKGEISFTKNLL